VNRQNPHEGALHDGRSVKKAEDSGALIAYPPTRPGQRGTFAIVIQGDVQHGLWQRQASGAND
jgi:hypothetical protein